MRVLIKHDGCHLRITTENKWMDVVDLFSKMLIRWPGCLQASDIGFKLSNAAIPLLLEILFERNPIDGVKTTIWPQAQRIQPP